MTTPSPDTSSYNLLLPENVRRKLDPLILTARRIRSGSMKGERRSINRGTSLEFADYRNYTPGDDLRKLDWNVYARLEKPYIKLLEDEEDLAVHLLLDRSASMRFPAADSDDDADDSHLAHQKLLYAQRVFAGLAYISLTTGDNLRMTAFSDAGWQRFGPVRGRGQIVPMLQYARAIDADGTTDLNNTLRDYAIREQRPGLLILLTDMFSPTGYTEGLNQLLGRGHEIVIIHVLSPDDVSPPMAGDLRLVDAETGTAREVTVDATMRATYQQRLNQWLDSIRDECARKGIHYMMTTTDAPYEKSLLYDLRRLGVIK